MFCGFLEQHRTRHELIQSSFVINHPKKERILLYDE